MNSKPFRLAVQAVIMDAQNRCLLIRRSTTCGNFAGRWEWPGGKPESGEDFTIALLREVREETSLEVQITGFAGATTFALSALHVVLLCMEARLLTGAVRLSQEHDAFAWVSLAELPQFSLADHVRNVAMEYLKRKGLQP